MDPSYPASFNHRTEKLSTGRSYHFVDQTPDDYNPAETITMLLVHGFPDLWYGWRNQIKPWVKAGYRVVVPDMLGYGGTDKPHGPAEYTTKKLSDDLAALLDFIGVQKAVIIGHDWGAYIVGRFALWHPDRLRALAILSVAFISPTPQYISLEQIVERFPGYGYQLYFAEEYSTKEIEVNVRTLFKLLLRLRGPLDVVKKGFLRSYIIGETPVNEKEIVGLLSDEELSYYLSQYDTIHGPLSYYRTTKLRFEEEKAGNLPARLRDDLPVLFIRGVLDPTSPAEAAEEVHKLISNLKVISVEAGHWVMVQTKDRVNDEVLTWLSELNLKTEL